MDTQRWIFIRCMRGWRGVFCVLDNVTPHRRDHGSEGDPGDDSVEGRLGLRWVCRLHDKAAEWHAAAVNARDLGALRAAPTLTWVPHTVFEPGEGVDGTVYGGRASFPVDVYSPDELEPGMTEGFSGGGGVGVVIAQPDTPAEALQAVRRWCRQHLGRDDVTSP